MTTIPYGRDRRRSINGTADASALSQVASSATGLGHAVRSAGAVATQSAQSLNASRINAERQVIAHNYRADRLNAQANASRIKAERQVIAHNDKADRLNAQAQALEFEAEYGKTYESMLQNTQFGDDFVKNSLAEFDMQAKARGKNLPKGAQLYYEHAINQNRIRVANKAIRVQMGLERAENMHNTNKISQSINLQVIKGEKTLAEGQRDLEITLNTLKNVLPEADFNEIADSLRKGLEITHIQRLIDTSPQDAIDALNKKGFYQNINANDYSQYIGRAERALAGDASVRIARWDEYTQANRADSNNFSFAAAMEHRKELFPNEPMEANQLAVEQLAKETYISKTAKDYSARIGNFTLPQLYRFIGEIREKSPNLLKGTAHESKIDDIIAMLESGESIDADIANTMKHIPDDMKADFLNGLIEMTQARAEFMQKDPKQAYENSGSDLSQEEWNEKNSTYHRYTTNAERSQIVKGLNGKPDQIRYTLSQWTQEQIQEAQKLVDDDVNLFIAFVDTPFGNLMTKFNNAKFNKENMPPIFNKEVAKNIGKLDSEVFEWVERTGASVGTKEWKARADEFRKVLFGIMYNDGNIISAENAINKFQSAMESSAISVYNEQGDQVLIINKHGEYDRRNVEQAVNISHSKAFRDQVAELMIATGQIDNFNLEELGSNNTTKIETAGEAVSRWFAPRDNKRNKINRLLESSRIITNDNGEAMLAINVNGFDIPIENTNGEPLEISAEILSRPSGDNIDAMIAIGNIRGINIINMNSGNPIAQSPIYQHISNELDRAKKANAPISGEAMVIDGDTIIIGNEKLRLIGINAAELTGSQGKGAEAKAFLENAIKGQQITCSIMGTDQHGRKMASCKINNTDIGKMLVQSGHATAYSHFNRRYVKDEQAAQAAQNEEDM